MSIWDYFPSSPDDWAYLFFAAIEKRYRGVEIASQNMGVLRARIEAERRCKVIFADGAWHGQDEINKELGDWAYETMELLLRQGHDFEKGGKDYRMVRCDPSKGPRRCGRILDLGLPLASTPDPNTHEHTPVTARLAKPEGRGNADNLQPSPPALSSPLPAEETIPQVIPAAQDERSDENPPGDRGAMSAAASTPIPVPASSVVARSSERMSQASATTSSPPRAAARVAYPELNAAPPMLRGISSAAPLLSHQARSTGSYRWQHSLTTADLIALGITTYYRTDFLAIDIIKYRKVIARMAMNPRSPILRELNVGLVYKDEDDGRRILRCDAIGCHDFGGSYFLHLNWVSLRKTAPRIASLRYALLLDRDPLNLSVELQQEVDLERNFAIRTRFGSVICRPMVVKVERRRTSVPLVKLEFYRGDGVMEARGLDFCGGGFMSWSSAIAFAHHAHLYAKIAPPEGGWIVGELVADVVKSSDGKLHGRGLKLRLDSLPARLRSWAARFTNIFELPLVED